MYTIPSSYTKELATYRDLTSKALRNEFDPVRYKIYRVVRGVYEQRQRGTYMVRIRCAGGYISPEQFSGISQLAKVYGSSYIHITTRQELQLHNLTLEQTPEVLETLYLMGLSTKGSGGNTVRNITASPESGISNVGDFDVLPYNIALTNYLISYEKAFDLPRKLKIAFSSSEKDTALAAFSDLGFIAKKDGNIKGFKVYIGGSPAVKPMIGEVLYDFIPADKILGVTLAVIELFHTHGNRKNRNKARLRYLFYKEGKDRVFDLFRAYYNHYKYVELELPGISEQSESMIIPDKQPQADKPEFKRWIQLYANKQPQHHLYSVEIPVMHGNLTFQQADALASFASKIGADTIRFTRRQNIHLRNIPLSRLEELYSLLDSLQFDIHTPFVLSNMVSCTGADTCQLGICFSKGGLKAIYDKLSSEPALKDLKDITINISGCPNSCGQHQVADLGFAGRVSRNDRLYPSYNIFAGASIGENNTALPELLGVVAAKDLPAFTRDILALYQKKSKNQTFRNFLADQKESIAEVIQSYKKIPSFEEDPKYYIDWGNNDLFTLEARGDGECSAGLLDMIESEIKTIKICIESLSVQPGIEEQTILLHELAVAALKLLALTKTSQIPTERDLFNLVEEQFLRNNRLDKAFLIIIEYLRNGDFAGLIRYKQQVINFGQKAIDYYKKLGDNLLETHPLQEITARDLKSMIEIGENFKLIDVREAWEKDIVDLGGELIPIDQLKNQQDRINTKQKTILYCRTGRRSAEAIDMLSKYIDVSNIYNLKGGIYAWADSVDSSTQKY